MQAVVTGFLTGLGLILAIGPQNAFVLRQGLRREHVGPVVAFCVLSDAVLIALGVAGMGRVAAAAPWIGPAVHWGAAGFLAVYGTLRFRAALRGGAALLPAPAAAGGLAGALGVCAALTWANPHVWLDTVLLVGSLAGQSAAPAAFGAGAAAASALFFTALGYGARLLAPVFARPAAWVVLEVVVGATMWALALALVLGPGAG